MRTSNIEPFIHGRLVKQLDPHYVMSRCDADMVSYPVREHGHMLFDLHDENGQATVHILLMKPKKSIGYVFTHGSPKVIPRKYPEPMVVGDDTDSPEEERIQFTAIGEVDGLADEWAYLLSKEGRMRAILRSPQHKLMEQRTKGDYPIDVVAHDVVREFFADRFYSTIDPNVRYSCIDVYDSVMSRLALTDMSIPKEMLLRSPFLKDGATFVLPNGENHKRRVTVWVEDAPLEELNEKTVYMWVEEYEDDYRTGVTWDGHHDGGLDDFYCYFFHVDELPDKLNEKTIARFFKKMQFKNKKREARERAWVCEKFGFFNEDGSPYGDPTELRYQVQLAFINHAVMARNYTQVEETDGDWAIKKERVGCKDLFTTLLKLMCAMWDPKLKGQLKRVKAQRTRQVTRKTQRQVKASRKWTWGNDRIRYIAPRGEGNKITTRFYTRPTMGQRYVNNVEKYGHTDGFYELAEPINGRAYSAFVHIKGHWKGEGEDDEFPEYFVGRPPKKFGAMAVAWLKRVAKEQGIHIQHAGNGGEVKIMGTPYRVDGYCEETNTIYEFHGDYWHGNPVVYDRDEMRHGKTMGEYYDNTIERENVLRSMGYNLVVMWESDWKVIA